MSLFACSDLLSRARRRRRAGRHVRGVHEDGARRDGYPPDRRRGRRAAGGRRDRARRAAGAGAHAQAAAEREGLQLDHARAAAPVELRDGFDRDKARELAYVHVGCEFTLPPRGRDLAGARGRVRRTGATTGPTTTAATPTSEAARRAENTRGSTLPPRAVDDDGVSACDSDEMVILTHRCVTACPGHVVLMDSSEAGGRRAARYAAPPAAPRPTRASSSAPRSA